MNERNLAITVPCNFGERLICFLPESFVVEVETEGKEISVSFRQDGDCNEKVASIVIPTEDCDTDVFTQSILHKFQIELVDMVCQGICEHLFSLEKCRGRLFMELDRYAMAWGESAKTIYDVLVSDKNNLKQ